MKHFFTVLLLIILSAPAIASGDTLFGAQKVVLDNGLEIIAIPNSKAPVVSHMIWYQVGAADEPNGQSGIAHYMEHLMFKGSAGLKPGEYSKKIRALGGNDNAFTSQDYTAYFSTIASKYLNTVMQMEAGRMKALKVPDDEAASELKVVLEERRQRLENNPAALLQTDMQAALYPNHPYGTPIIGWKPDIEGLNNEKALSFFNTHYAPNNAILVVAGDIEMDVLESMAQKYFGDLEERDVPERFVVRKAEPMPAKKTLALEHELVKQPAYYRSYRVPSWIDDKQTALALDILQELLDGGSDAPLYQDLVVEHKKSSGANLNYSFQSLGPSEVTIAAYPAEDVSLEELGAAIDAFIKKYDDKEWSANEIEAAVTKIQDSMVFLRDSVTGPAMIVGRALSSGMSLNDIETYTQQLETITPDMLNAVVDQWLSSETNYVEGYLKPAPLLEKKQEGNDA